MTFLAPANWFDRWWEPHSFAVSVCAHKQNVPLTEFMCTSELKPLREAWVAAKFATILSQDRAVSIKLERDRFPDFTLKIRDKIQSYELVEADRAGRRRSREYRRAALAMGEHTELEHFDPAEEERAALPAVVNAIRLKAKKHYWPRPHLLVYVNFCLEGEPPIEELVARQIADLYQGSFESAWLLWGQFVVRLWPRAAKIRDRSRRGS